MRLYQINTSKDNSIWTQAIIFYQIVNLFINKPPKIILFSM